MQTPDCGAGMRAIESAATMVSPTLASQQTPRSRRTWLRFTLAVVVLLIGVAAGAAAWFWHAAERALPQLDGTIRIAGLSAPVTVVRDAQGVPHITAASAQDLFLAQGFVTAQDRMWQMDIARRWGAGEVAEIFGETMLPHDREQRILGMRQIADRAAAGLPGAERAQWEAYARGVNAYLESHADNLPIEFRLLRYRPKPWTVADSMLCGANMAQALNHYEYMSVLGRERVTQKLGAERAADLYLNSSWRDHPPGLGQGEFEPSTDTPPDETEETQPTKHAVPRRHRRPRLTSETIDPSRSAPLPAGMTPGSGEITSDAAPALGIEPEAMAPGSNNWAISGAHTASGKPLLSNDMHLVNTIPNTWYEAHLTVAGGAFDVAGVTVPGMPYVVVGHNRRIAWGFTNLGPSVEDLYIETVNPNGQYRAPDGWHDLERRVEAIHVQGRAEPVEMEVLATRHGPIVSSLVPGESRALALKWTLFTVPLTAPFYNLDAAQNWQEFRAALSTFNVPSQNVVYADVDGHIGYQATGKIPIRAAEAPVPVPGNDDAHEWTGYVPFDALPSVFDPPSGVVATANGRIATDGYPHTLSYEWGPPYRTERIYRVLNSVKKFTPEDLLRLQTDVYSAFDKFCADHFVYAVDHAANATQRARAAANVMRGWDGKVTVDSRAAEVVAVTRREVWRRLLEPRLGPANTAANGTLMPRQLTGWAQYQWFMSSVAFETLLTRQPARWLPEGVSNFDELIAAAVDKAVTDDVRTRAWGNEHRIDLRHPVFGQLPLIGKYFGTGSHPLPGDGTTVKQVGGGLGPSQRFTADLNDLDRSTMNIVTGESGELFSPHWMDQWSAYYEGRTFVLPFSAAAVQNSGKHTLTLQPKSTT